MFQKNRSLKVKIINLLVLPFIILVVCMGFSFNLMLKEVAQMKSVREYSDVVVNFEKLEVSANAIPRRIWAAVAFDDNAEARNKRLAWADEEFKKVKNWIQIAHENRDKYSAELDGKVKPFSEIANLDAAFEKYEAVFNEVKPLLMDEDPKNDHDAKKVLSDKIGPISESIHTSVEMSSELIAKAIEEQFAKVESSVNSAMTLLSLFMVGGCLVTFVISFMMINGINRDMGDIIQRVTQSSDQVNSASYQISNASQQLASVSQTQASSIEETSAALAEMAGMVEKNTQNAERSAELAKNVKVHTEKSVISAAELLKSMQNILESNQKIEHLVKVIEEIGEKTSLIDEIVFQTKLLSFNASVEAERAGEHGRGFAVVAQEVGSLAQMSGKSALEISGIVKSSVKEAAMIATENKQKVDYGYRIVQEIENVLKDVESSANQVMDLSHQVLEASEEQNTGISQINISVDNINKTTQETAATAEEAASAAEELSSQSDSLQEMVKRLAVAIKGSNQSEASTLQPSNVVPLVGKNKKDEFSETKMVLSGGSAVGAWEKL